MQSETKPIAVYVILAQLGLLAAWQALANSGAAGLTVPTPASVVRVYLQPRFAALLYRSALATLSSAVAGFAVGALLGTVTAIVSYVLPPLPRSPSSFSSMLPWPPACARPPPASPR